MPSRLTLKTPSGSDMIFTSGSCIKNNNVTNSQMCTTFPHRIIIVLHLSSRMKVIQRVRIKMEALRDNNPEMEMMEMYSIWLLFELSR